MYPKTDIRPAHGAAIIVLVFVLGFFIIGVLGIFSYEVTRNNSARDELRSACEAASLAGASALASSDQTNPSITHTLAETAAYLAFEQNSILGIPLNGNDSQTDSQSSSAAATMASSPAANKAIIYVEFQDTSGVVQPWSSATGRVVHVVAAFGELPSFGKYVGIDKASVFAQGQAQVPMLDIVMCFDNSGSIDDQTNVLQVQRLWNSATGKNTYNITAKNTIYALESPPATGTQVNAYWPQHLDQSGNFVSGSRGTEAGAQAPSTSLSAGQYTDLVVWPVDTNGSPIPVNASGTFTGPSAPPTATDPAGIVCTFPDVATLVEASRGNLNSAANFTSSKASVSLPTTPSPAAAGADWYGAYWNYAQSCQQPIGTARLAAEAFFSIMNNNTVANFGFVSFATDISATPGFTTGSDGKIYGSSGGGSLNVPLPGTSLTAGTSTATNINTNIIPLTRASYSTDIGDAATEAVNELVSKGRQGATKAVVFFTDGQPTVGPSWSSAAATANTNGIAIYTVGLAQNSAIIPAECDNLNDTAGKTISYTDPLTGTPSSYTPAAGGMAAVAGHGGQFFLVTNRQNLRFVFENIARSLVQLAKS